jgi:DNA-binding winged helix-turn-helix (wHTH) protein
MERDVRFDGFRFELGSGRLWSGAQEIRLTPKAAAVLGVLVAHAGDPVSKEALFESVWRDTVVTDDALVSCIRELRRALGDDAREPRYIETRHRRGYRFAASLTPGTAEGAAARVPGISSTAHGADGGSARGPSRAATVTARLPMTEALARRLDRNTFDPRMIGDSLEYLDNRAESDVLVMLMNAAWLDSADLEPHLRMLPYRCIAPTLFGFEPGARHRFELSLRDHLVVLAELLRATADESAPALVIVAGFSSAADLVLRLAGTPFEGARTPDGVLALGCNQALATCFVSRLLARLESTDPAELLRALRAIGDAAGSLDDWTLVHGYVGRIMARFGTDVTPLRSLARGIVEPFEADDAGAFAAMYREALARVRSVRCVFEDSETCNRLLRGALVDHMDRRVLGERHRDGALVIEPTPSHFELLQPERVARHLAAVVEELRGTA